MSVSRRGLKRSVFKRYTSLEVKAGVLAGATYPADMLTDARTGEQVPDRRAGMPVAVIARALHYGFGQNHPRPFIGQAVSKNGRDWARAFTKLATTGVPMLTAAKTVGQIMREDIQQEIRDWPADNAKAWAAFKGFNHGLVLTSHLLNSIDFQTQVAKS